MKFNLPTKLTFLRLILSLIVIFLLVFPFYRIGIEFPTFLFKNILIDLKNIIAGVIFVGAAITDYFDGKLARKYKQVTDFGKFVDAIADKVLVNSVLIIFAGLGFIDVIIPVVIIIRDIVVDAIRMLASNKGKVISARYLGKIKTASLMIGLVLTFFYNLPFEIWGIRVSDFFLYFGMIMAIISMFDYYNLNKKIIFSEFERN